jgi:hypothetical protein
LSVVARLMLTALLFVPAVARADSVPVPVMDIVGLFSLGLDFAKNRAELRGNKCLTKNEADGRLNEAMGIFGAAAGAVVLPSITGRPQDFIGGAAAGGTLGTLYGRAVMPKAGATPTGAGRDVEYTICQRLENGRELRKPIVRQLVDEIGTPCGVPLSSFNASPELGPDTAWRRLFACARQNAALQARLSNYLDQLGSINYAVCLSANSEIHALNVQRASTAKPGNGVSYMPTPVETCTKAAPETFWSYAYKGQ